jgi:diguanylate cyclase (GGDEF)-like protein
MVKSVNKAAENNGELTVLFLDLDGFKKVNDTLGHDVGDLLLQEVATRLKSCTREVDTVARLAGDEFTIILSQTPKKKAVGVAERILEELQKPFSINNNQVMVTTSIGIALYSEHGPDSETLMKYADKAMYQAKKHGKNNYRIYKATPEI